MRRLAAITLSLALVPALAACATGVSAPTTVQQASGNGSSAQIGKIALRGVTIVKGGGGLPIGTFVGTIVNTSDIPDVLQSVEIVDPSGARTTIAGTNEVAGRLVIPPTSSTQIGYEGTTHVDIAGLTIDPSAYASVVFSFVKSGKVTVKVMAVQPIGIYAGIGPLAR